MYKCLFLFHAATFVCNCPYTNFRCDFLIVTWKFKKNFSTAKKKAENMFLLCKTANSWVHKNWHKEMYFFCVMAIHVCVEYPFGMFSKMLFPILYFSEIFCVCDKTFNKHFIFETRLLAKHFVFETTVLVQYFVLWCNILCSR